MKGSIRKFTRKEDLSFFEGRFRPKADILMRIKRIGLLRRCKAGFSYKYIFSQVPTLVHIRLKTHMKGYIYGKFQ